MSRLSSALAYVPPQSFWDDQERRRLINYRQHKANILRRYRTDPGYRMMTACRARMRNAMLGKGKRDYAIIGCGKEQLRAHLEALFLPGMSWENYGQWEVDHIRPCSSFDLLDPAQQRTCFHYSNLRPLWRHDNREKWAKVDWQALWAGL